MFFFRYEHVFDRKCFSPNLQDALFFLLGSVLEHHQINEDVLRIIIKKKEQRKKKLEVHVFAYDWCQANLSMGWLV